jgi:hypothetical protein
MSSIAGAQVNLEADEKEDRSDLRKTSRQVPCKFSNRFIPNLKRILSFLKLLHS